MAELAVFYIDICSVFTVIVLVTKTMVHAILNAVSQTLFLLVYVWTALNKVDHNLSDESVDEQSH